MSNSRVRDATLLDGARPGLDCIIETVGVLDIWFFSCRLHPIPVGEKVVSVIISDGSI